MGAPKPCCRAVLFMQVQALTLGLNDAEIVALELRLRALVPAPISLTELP
jgi:hypothetical protein